MPDPTDLTVSLSLLPSIPVASPLVYQWPGGERRGLFLGYFRRETIIHGTDVELHRARRSVSIPDAALDLSPPYPPGSHVDGLDVGLRLLGWLPGQHIRISDSPVGGIALQWDGTIYDADEVHGLDDAILALADIDPNHPHALRQAVCEVLRAKGAKG